MTYEDDMIRVRLRDGRRVDFMCKPNGIEWPPPEHLYLRIPIIGGGEDRAHAVRLSYSAITDEQRSGMTHVFRGAEYEEATP